MEWLPIAVLTTPLMFALLLWVARNEMRNFVLILGGGSTLALTGYQAWSVVRFGPIVSLAEEIRVDGVGATIALLISALMFVCSLYAVGYLPGIQPREQERREQIESRTQLFMTLFMVLNFTLIWVVMTNNIVILWVALEATTLASALLVSFYWDKRALEAGYKYVLLLTVGITFALFGCVLLYSAAAPHLGSESTLLMTNLKKVMGQLPPHLVLIASLLLVVGFGTKAGLAPFHPWVADAYAESPTVMSAFLSSAISKVPFVAIFRVLTLFNGANEALNHILLGLGAFTMVLGAVLALVQDDLKRLHAYSSVSQYGYIVVGFGTGIYLGYYGAFYHLISHSLCKALLFLATGSVVYAAHNIRSISSLGGLARRLPVTTLCFFAGALALSGFPPFSGFMSKITVVLATTEVKAFGVTSIAVLISLLTLAYMMRVAQLVFLGTPRSAELQMETVQEVPLPMLLAMLLLALAVLALGIAPGLLDPLLNMASKM